MEKEEVSQTNIYQDDQGNYYLLAEDGNYYLYDINTGQVIEDATSASTSAPVADHSSYELPIDDMLPIENSGGKIKEVVEEEEPQIHYSTSAGIKAIGREQEKMESVRCGKWLNITTVDIREKENMRAWFDEMPKECIDALEHAYDCLHTISWNYINMKKFHGLKEVNGIHPSLTTVMRPFGLIHPSRARVVMIGLRPYLNGTANGIPIESQKRGMLETTPSFKAFRYACTEAFRVPRDNIRDEDVIRYYYNNGILLLNSEMTAEVGFDKRYDIVRNHLKLWAEFYYPFLQHCRDKGRAIVLLGKGAHSLKKAVYDYKYLKCARFPSTEDWSSVEDFVDLCEELYVCNTVAELKAAGIDPEEFLQSYYS